MPEWRPAMSLNLLLLTPLFVLIGGFGGALVEYFPLVLLLNFLPYLSTTVVAVGVALLIVRRHIGLAYVGVGALFIMVTFFAAAPPSASEPARARPYAMFHNVQKSPTAQRRTLRRAAQKNIPVVGIAEVNRDALRTYVENSDYHNHMEVAPDGDGSGVAVVTRRKKPTYRPRISDLVAMGVRHSNRQVLFIHAPSPKTIKAYRARNRVLKRLQSAENDMIIGDFNATIWSQPMIPLGKTYRRARQPFAADGTWPSSSPVGITIDHALVQEPARVRTGSSAHSDHSPLTVLIEPER